MNVVIGLGNPGKKYEETRHNVGFMVLNRLAAELGLSFSASKKTGSEIAKMGDNLLLGKPQAFMNHSGQSVRAILEFYDIALPNDSSSSSNLFVVHDDLDLSLGSTKLQLGVGPKSHNGLLSIYEHVGTHNFWHVRLGVDNRGQLRNSIVPSEYVLQPFLMTEQPIIETSIKNITSELQSIIGC